MSGETTNTESRSVWLLARPKTAAPEPERQDENVGLFHWGVLITELGLDDIRISLTDKLSTTDDMDLGTLWQLSRDGQDNAPNAHSFRLSSVKENGLPLSAELIGVTSLTDNEIQREGIVPFPVIILI
jgi:hypothetical protein